MRKKYVWFALAAIISFSVLIRTYPLFQHALWGYDCGEYVYYANHWVNDGKAFLEPQGWGKAYPFFPSLFIVGGSFSLLTGADIQGSLLFVPIVIGAFSPLFIFILTHRLTRSAKPAVLASLFFTCIPPVIYHYSQTKPETLAFFILTFILALVLIFYQRQDVRYLFLLFPASIALIVTHHLTAYFLMLFLVGGLFLSWIWKREVPLSEKQIFYFYIIFALLVIPYWVFLAPPFRHNRIYKALGTPGHTIVLAPFLVALFIRAVSWLRQRYDFKVPVDIHDEDINKFYTVTAFSSIILSAIIGYVAFWRIPGRGLKLGLTVFIYVPILFLSFFAIPARKWIRAMKEGPHILGWFLLTTLSMILGVISGTTSLLPSRHLSFLFLSVSILFGIGLYHLQDYYNPRGGLKRKAAIALVVFLILALNIPFSYPSPEMLQNFDERTGWKDVECAYWMKGTSRKIGTGHRLSSASFSVSNKNLTWIDEYHMFYSSDYRKAVEEIDKLNVTYIMWDEQMKESVNTRPSENPRPFNPELRHRYKQGYLLYTSKECYVYPAPNNSTEDGG